jgi:hypothetical protein
MYLNKEIDVMAFLKAVNNCEGEVLLHTTQKDVLNLKSTLCRYVFAFAALKKELIDGAEVVCDNKNDLLMIGEYLTE